MKRNYTIALLFMVIAFSAFLFVGCFQPSTAYIKVAGFKSEYYVGDSIDTSSAKVEYYQSETTEKPTSVPLTVDMITGFSTDNIGTFKMIVTYKNLTTSVSYVVKQPLPPPVSLTEQQAAQVFAQTIANMKTFAEIQETTTTSLLGATVQTIYVTRPTYQYKYSEEDGKSWLFKNGEKWDQVDVICAISAYDNILKDIMKGRRGGKRFNPLDAGANEELFKNGEKWEYYEIAFDVFDDVWENNKYEAQLEYDNLIEMHYQKIITSSITPIEFVEAQQQGDECLLVYASPDFLDMQTKISIKTTKLFQ